MRHPIVSIVSMALALGLAAEAAPGSARQASPTRAVALEQFVRDHPGDPQALAALGELYNREGRSQEAEPLLARAVKLAPGLAAARLEWAVSLARLHRYRPAQTALRGVSPPSDAEQLVAFLRLKASIDAGLGEASRAASDMERALEIRPGEASLLLAAGVAESAAGQWSPAARHLEAAAAQMTPSPEILFDLALAQFRSGDVDAAEATGKRARSIADSAAIEDLLGDIQEARGASLDAVHSYQAAVTLAPEDERYRLALGLELLRHQTFEPARVVFQQAAALFPRSTRLKVALALTDYFLERHPDATDILVEAAKSDPSSTLVFRYLGELQLTGPASPDPAAISELCRYADAHPGQGSADAYCGAALLRMAREAGGRARQREIVRRLERAARLSPGDPTARCELGRAFQWTGDWQRARAEMEACVRLDPASAEAHYRLAQIDQHLGLRELAQTQFALQRQAEQSQVNANARRDATLTKFLFSMDRPGEQAR